MRLQLTIEIWKKGDWYLARTPELDFISQGRTQEEAKKNLLEVIRIQFKEMKENNILICSKKYEKKWKHLEKKLQECERKDRLRGVCP